MSNDHASKPDPMASATPASDALASDALARDSSESELRGVLIAVASAGIAITAVVAYLQGSIGAISAGFGALLGFGNLLILGRMVRSFLSRGTVSMPWLIAALLKLAVLFLAMYLPVRAGVLALLPFVFGFGALPVGIVLGQFLVPSSSNKAI